MIALLRRLLCCINGHLVQRTPGMPAGWSEQRCHTCDKSVMVFLR